jgi:large subunit ribosomal protein L3
VPLKVPPAPFFVLKNMIDTILAKKGEMSQTFVEGRRVPVTKVLAGPCVVTHIKKEEKDGYWAVQLGFGEKRIKNVSKAVQGHLKGAIKDKKAPRFLREVRLNKEPDLKVGDVVKVSDIFTQGDIISVSGTSKGKGFAGGVKRWGFAGGPRTHGQSDRERAPGSIGQTTTPGRVFKGKHMAGRMGNEKVTLKNLQIVSVDEENNELTISGPVPGIIGGLLTIKRLSAGRLEGITEVQAQVVEGEAEAENGEEKGEGQVQEVRSEVPQEEEKENE